ncbi:MAG: CpsD/CapB family tyrosine-protein kinase [Candidatus Thiodiazotropha sp. (ex Epidulcina cf. delphinae)]|nr:CpsD/CapB family tyrosine-protein kinase [Candidatus Thiodiazotropha sp. (ex Epidulcina cf. delphinae)]
MERLKIALEKAREGRLVVATETNDYKKPQLKRAAPLSKIVYTHTKLIEVDSDVLRENCILTGSGAGPVTDAYKVLRTHVLQHMRANQWNTLAVTSPTGGNGKTITAINLAISLSREVNQTVLLVDLDLRRPSIQSYFSMTGYPGISDYLLGNIEISSILVNPGIERLVILPGNKSIENSSEMLSSPKMLALVEELKTFYPHRIVIFDMPPTLSCDDVLAFSPYVDSLLMVIEGGKTKKADLERSLYQHDRAKIIGTVLNKSRTDFSIYSPDSAY